jgi:hypothetical protein
LRSEEESGSTIVEGRSVSSGDSSVLLENRSEGRNFVGLDLLVLLVLRDDNVSSSCIGDRYRRDLVLESTSFPGFGSLAVRFEAEVVLVFSGNLVLLGGLLSTISNWGLSVCVRASFELGRTHQIPIG